MLALAAACTVAFQACTEERITAISVSSVIVEPAAPTVLVGEQVELDATVLDERGEPVANPAVTWISEDPAVAEVSPAGVVSARAPGTVEVEAAFGNVRDHAVVRVLAGAVLSVSRTAVRMAAAEGGAPPEPEVLEITNSGVGPLEGVSAAVTYPDQRPSGWLRAELAGAAAPTTLTLEADPAALSVGVHEATVALTAPDAANSPLNVAVTLVVGRLTVTESGGSTTVFESGTTDAFTLVLMSQPSSNVVLDLTSSDPGEATVSPATLTFTPASWSTAQTVTVTGVDDTADDGDQTSTVRVSVNDAASDDAFDDLADETVSVTTVDDDEAPPPPPPAAGYTVSETGGSTSVSETGTTDTFTLVLMSQPSSNVVLDLTSSDPGEATVSPTTLTFTPTSWSTAQTVTVTGVDDTADDGDQTSTVRVSVNDAASDDAFDDLADETVSVTTVDDDEAPPPPPPGISIEESGGSTRVTESGGTDTFTVVLDSQPTNPVVLTVTSSDTGEATVSPTTLTFTPSNWSQPQTVTVAGVNDLLPDGDQVVPVTVAVDDLLSDDAYDGLSETVQVTNVDIGLGGQ